MSTLKSFGERLDIIESDRHPRQDIPPLSPIAGSSSAQMSQPPPTGGDVHSPTREIYTDDEGSSEETAFSGESEVEEVQGLRRNREPSLGTRGPQQLYPLPEDALLIENCSGFIWHDQTFSHGKVIVLREPTAASP